MNRRQKYTQKIGAQVTRLDSLVKESLRRRRTGKLCTRGTPAADAMVSAQVAENSALLEATHELHEEYTEGGYVAWETIAVGSEAAMLFELSRLQARTIRADPRTKKRARRVVARERQR